MSSEVHIPQEQAGAYAKTMKLYNEMKITVFTFSLLKIIIVQVSLLFVKEEESIDCWNTIEIVAVSLTGSLLGVVTICLFLYGICKQVYRSEISKAAMVSNIVADFMMLLANWCYFAGDSITNFYNIQSENASKYRYASQLLLVMGLTGFVFVPRFKKVVQKHFHDDNTKDDEMEWRDLAKSQNFINNVIALLLETDALYTILTNIVLECNTAQTIMPWFIYTIILISLAIYLILQAKRVIAQMTNIDDKIMAGFVTTSVVIVAALYLLMDNNKPLNCSGHIKCTVSNTFISNNLNSNTINIPGPYCNHNNTTRLVMTFFAVLIYMIPFAIKFYIIIKKFCRKYVVSS
uniref:Uncharacterized protein n=1 Tax=Amphimedon queenslandica TaxID=400682 RepID=A0A1X7TZ84_AMPQE